MQYKEEGVCLWDFEITIQELQKHATFKHDLPNDKFTIFDCSETSFDFWLIGSRVKRSKSASE